MEVDFSYYLGHYFDVKSFGTFFLLAFGTLFVIFVVLYVYSLVTAKGSGIERKENVRINWHVLLERFYEMIYSGTSILFFIAIYYLINRFFTIEPYRSIWDKYKDFFLMILIILSCLYNSFLDRGLTRFKFLTRDERSAGRLTGMVYMLIIFAYIKFIYENDNYDMFITYFLGLMVGRFAYFDSTIHDFVKAIDGVRKNLVLMILALLYTSVMCLYGFKTGYLITHNGVITNVFITHLFMCIAIFILFHLHIAEFISGKGGRRPRTPSTESEEYEDDYYGDDRNYYQDDYKEYGESPYNNEYYDENYYPEEELYEDDYVESHNYNHTRDYDEDDDLHIIDIN